MPPARAATKGCRISRPHRAKPLVIPVTPRNARRRAVVINRALDVTSPMGVVEPASAGVVTRKSLPVPTRGTRPARIVMSHTRARASRPSARRVTRPKRPRRTARSRTIARAAIAPMGRRGPFHPRPARRVIPWPRCPAFTRKPRSTKRAARATAATVKRPIWPASFASLVTPIAARTSQKRVARTVICSRAAARSRHAEGHLAIDVQVGPQEGLVVRRDVLVTGAAYWIERSVRMRRRRR